MSKLTLTPFRKNLAQAVTCLAPIKKTFNDEVNYQIPIVANPNGAPLITKLPALFSLGVYHSKLYNTESMTLSLTSQDGTQSPDEKAVHEFLKSLIEKCKNSIMEYSQEMKDLPLSITEDDLAQLDEFIYSSEEKSTSTFQVRLIPSGTYKTRFFDGASKVKKIIPTPDLYVDKEKKVYHPVHVTPVIRVNHIWISSHKISLSISLVDAKVTPREEEERVDFF